MNSEYHHIHLVLMLNKSQGKIMKRNSATYISSSSSWTPTLCFLGLPRNKMQGFRGAIVATIMSMLLRGRTWERTILPEVDHGGRAIWKGQRSKNGYLVILIGRTQPRHRITDGWLLQLGAGASYGCGIRSWAPTGLWNSHKGLCSNHSLAHVVFRVDTPSHPPICWRDTPMSECYVKLATGLVICPVKIRGQLWKITTIFEHLVVRECLAFTCLSEGCCKKERTQNRHGQHEPQHHHGCWVREETNAQGDLAKVENLCLLSWCNVKEANMWEWDITKWMLRTQMILVFASCDVIWQMPLSWMKWSRWRHWERDIGRVNYL